MYLCKCRFVLHGLVSETDKLGPVSLKSNFRQPIWFVKVLVMVELRIDPISDIKIGRLNCWDLWFRIVHV